MDKKCYWCSAEATSKEHVPPKCIFPELKDLSDGVDRRIELITVPSCDSHNSAKSKDDEYLLGIFAICILNNEVGTNQSKSKVIRALRNNPTLAKEILAEPKDITVEYIDTGKMERTVAFKLDHARMTSAVEHMARALYFNHFKDRWPGNVISFAEFQVALHDNSAEENAGYEELRKAADELLAASEKHGANQDVFYYQVLDMQQAAGALVFRLTFYEGTCILCKFIY